MDRRITIILISVLILFSTMMAFKLSGSSYLGILAMPIFLLLGSFVFFSRGILIFLITICLMLSGSQFPELGPIINMNLRWVLFGLITFHVFGDIFLGRTVRRIKSFDVLAFIFLIYAFLSSFYSPDPKLTLERATTILFLYISIFWIIWKYAYDQGPQKVAYLILQVAMLIFIVNYLMIFIVPQRAFMFGRFTGLFHNPNSLALISAIFLPLAYWQFLDTKKKTALFLFILILAAILLSASRNSLNAAVISMGYFIYARSKKYRPLTFFFSLTFIFIIIFAIQTVAQEFFKQYIRTKTIPTIGGRIDIWPLAWRLFSDKPIFGYGFGVEDKIIRLQYPLLPEARHLSYIHNSYLGMLLQLGIAGFIIFYGPLLVLLFKELSSKEQDGNVSTFRYALRASLLSGLLCCIYESWVYSAGNSHAFPFWVMVMLLLFCRQQDREKSMLEST